MTDQVCVHCEKPQPKTILIHRCGLCERCEMSVLQEQKIHELFAEGEGQMCSAQYHSGRPCWEPTQLGAIVCRSKNCPSRHG